MAEARAVFERLGAVPMLARLDEILAAGGGDVRPPAAEPASSAAEASLPAEG